MPWHDVQQGEDLVVITALYGMVDPEKIREHPDNAEFFKTRSDFVLAPGDRIFVPNRVTKEEIAKAEQKTRFVVRAQKRRLRLILKDPDGEPIASVVYQLSVDGAWIEGMTDGEGAIEEKIPNRVRKASLTVEGRMVELLIGELDPVERVSGLQARLDNLGFDPGSVDGIRGPKTKAAVRRFQAAYNLEVDGISGPNTQMALVEAHRC